MRKSIQLEIRLTIDGDDEPARDWARATRKAIREIIAAGAKTRPDLRVKVRAITETS